MQDDEVSISLQPSELSAGSLSRNIELTSYALTSPLRFPRLLATTISYRTTDSSTMRTVETRGKWT